MKALFVFLLCIASCLSFADGSSDADQPGDNRPFKIKARAYVASLLPITYSGTVTAGVSSGSFSATEYPAGTGLGFGVGVESLPNPSGLSVEGGLTYDLSRAIERGSLTTASAVVTYTYSNQPKLSFTTLYLNGRARLGEQGTYTVYGGLNYPSISVENISFSIKPAIGYQVGLDVSFRSDPNWHAFFEYRAIRGSGTANQTIGGTAYTFTYDDMKANALLIGAAKDF